MAKARVRTKAKTKTKTMMWYIEKQSSTSMDVDR